MNSWISIFQQSRANNAPYYGDRLPQQIWRWPVHTWFQSRVRYVRDRHNESRSENRPARPRR